jgi:cytochrome c-type biogenesis protein
VKIINPSSTPFKVDVTLFILLFAVIAGISAAAFFPAVQAARNEAPPFTLTSIDGTSFNLSDYRGQVVVLDLMATWCSVCDKEMKELSQLREERPDVVIITITVDPTETDEMLSDYKEKHNVDWLFARDTDHVWVKYRDLGLPTLVFIDPQGYLSFQKADFLSAEKLKLEVERAYSGDSEEPGAQEEPEETMTEAVIIFLQKIWSTYGLYIAALLLGLASLFAPCAFPLMPGYISYYLGRYEGGPTLSGSVKAGIAAATGINGIFAVIGVVVALGGVAVKSYITYLKPVVGIGIVLLGLAMLLNKTEIFDKLGFLLSSLSLKIGGKAQYSGLFMYGVGYGLACMECQAPVFIALIFAGLAAGGALEALLVFLSFSIGMGGMMIIVSVIVGTAKMKILTRLKEMMPLINRACGVILIFVGVYFLLEFV